MSAMPFMQSGMRGGDIYVHVLPSVPIKMALTSRRAFTTCSAASGASAENPVDSASAVVASGAITDTLW